MADEPERVSAGRFRAEQNWIGGRRSNPSDARYIPPPEDRVPALMADLVDFINREDLPAVAQAHLVNSGLGPFYDGVLHLLLSPNDLLGLVALGLLAGLRGPAASRLTVIALPITWSARRSSSG